MNRKKRIEADSAALRCLPTLSRRLLPACRLVWYCTSFSLLSVWWVLALPPVMHSLFEQWFGGLKWVDE